jgi:hypothetical protein
MNTLPRSSNLLQRFGLAVALTIGTLLVDGVIVAWLWATGVDFATMDRVEQGEPGFQIKPLLISHRWLLGAVLAANIGIVLYLLMKQRHWYALGFAVGATVPMLYLVNSLLH